MNKDNSDNSVITHTDAVDAVGAPATSRWHSKQKAQELISDDEIIILKLKPDPAFIILASLGSLFPIAFMVMLLAYLSNTPLISSSLITWSDLDALIFGLIIACIRLTWQALDWWNRVYILTDRRVITMSGIFRRYYYEAPLRNIQHLAIVRSFRERILSLGSIAYATSGSDRYDTIWLMLKQPFAIHKTISQTIERYGRGHCI